MIDFDKLGQKMLDEALIQVYGVPASQFAKIPEANDACHQPTEETPVGNRWAFLRFIQKGPPALYEVAWLIVLPEKE